MREFFLSKNFIEVPTQSRLSILAACENPHSVKTFEYGGEIWPLPQTGQMWLEYELLKNPEWDGVFCISTSYREEKNPIPGRHELIFPMFEFESKGGMDKLLQLESELLEHLGFDEPIEVNYDGVCEEYNKDGVIFNKVDVILYGQETIGSAERSCDVEKMREMFYSIEDGKYCAKLFELFGKDRVEKELNDFLSHKFFPRFGGGIGMTRMARAYELLKQEKDELVFSDN